MPPYYVQVKNALAPGTQHKALFKCVGEIESETLAQQWWPYIETGIEAFDVSRCMFESNFPVDRFGCDTSRGGTRSSASQRANRRPPSPPCLPARPCGSTD